MDCGFFELLKSAYKQDCNACFLSHANETRTQINVADLFKRDYLSIAALNKALDSFRTCGICSFNPHVSSPEGFALGQVSFLSNTAKKEIDVRDSILQGVAASTKTSN
jgi:hypothetical protein